MGILLLQLTGSYVYFMVRLSAIHKEMREQLKHRPDESLTLLTLTPEAYKKSKVGDDEVTINGKMYDIARILIKKDKVLVYALHDEAEDNLLALLNEMVKRSSRDKKPVPSQLIQLLTLQFVIIEDAIPEQAGDLVKHITPHLAFMPTFVSGIETPPPRG